MARVIVVGAAPDSLVRFRGSLLQSLARNGHTVTAMASTASMEQVRQIESLGVRFLSYPVERTGRNPLRDILTLVILGRAFRAIQPDVVLAYTAKAVIWSAIALRVEPQVSFIALITGLGYVFSERRGARWPLRLVVAALYRIALGRASAVIFQNEENLREFVRRKIVTSSQVHTVASSGIDLREFAFEALPLGPPVFLLLARLLYAKGLVEYASAARQVKRKYPDAVFRLYGGEDTSPDRVPMSVVRAWHDEGIIEYGGVLTDVRGAIRACHVYVLPSYHEGLPRSVIEAMAIGRPILTTDVPGCRETVVEGANGFRVPSGDAERLAEKMVWFIENPDRLPQLGRASREMCEDRFDVEKVNDAVARIAGLGR